MGDLILLGDRLEERSALRLDGRRSAFYFDLACPFSYLAAERIERLLGAVEWVPVRSSSLGAPADSARDRALEATARGLDRHGVCVLPAFRVGERWFEGEPSLLGAAARYTGETSPARIS